MRQESKLVVSPTAAKTAPGKRKRGGWLGRVLKILLILVLLLVVLTGSGFFWLVIRPLPQTSGTLQVAGLSAEVKVLRDRWGVPHITASSQVDLFMAQGFVTAQDRLWQMEFNRRIGSGRLSEVLGEAAIEEDRFLRTIGLRRAASAEEADLTPDQRQILDSYAAGVNAFITSHQDNLPVEFSLLGFKPEPWTALDTLTWGKVMAYDLSGNYTREILRANLVNKLGANMASQMLPTTGGANTPLIVPQGASYAAMEATAQLVNLQERVLALAGSDLEARGSNNWVISGAKSSTGKPVVANDPHLGIRNPSIWYEVELNGAGWHVAGVTFPGVPGVVAGHNERIAWGVTNVEGDTQDLYMEKINPANPNQYEFKGSWQDMTIIPEEIKLKGKPSQTIQVRLTRHGPIMNDVSASMKDAQPLALQWTALQKSPLLGAVLKYNRAANWPEFRDALREFNVPAQNFVYADVDGNIGYQIPGQWPLRAKGDGLLPVPGWTGEYEWNGYARFEDLPSVYNPPAGFVATANNRPVAALPDAKFYLGQEFDPGWRAARITTLLKAKDKLSLDDLKAIQTDVLSLPGQQFARQLGQLPGSEANFNQARQLLQTWDGRMLTGSVGATLYKVTYQYTIENLFKARLGDTIYKQYLDEARFHVPFVLSLLDNPNDEWWGPGGRDVLLTKSLQQALDYLKTKLGGAVNDWQWGKLHTANFAETPIGSAVPGPIALFLNLKTLPTNGDGNTVAAASYRFNDPYIQTSGQSFRGLYSLANFDDSLLTNTIGQSGQPLSKHYGDNIDDWSSAGYHSLLFSAQAVNSQSDKEVLTLKP